jgi:hypothetical protein
MSDAHMEETRVGGARRLTDVARDLGVTYRQADYWSSHGYIEVRKASRLIPADQLVRARSHEPKPVSDDSGSGYVRVIDDHEVEVLRLMVQLVNLTITPPMAAKLARQLVESPDTALRFGDVCIASTVGSAP